MRKIIFLLIILGCLIFCGCAATADIEYGIDADNNAYTKINIKINAENESAMDKYELQSDLRLLETFYRTERGFKSEYDYFTEDEDSAYLILTKSVPADSFEEAFENLKQMLCEQQLSVFSEVSCELSDTAPAYAYRINGRVDLHKVIENTYNSGISKGTADYTASLLESCSLSVTVSMPQNSSTYPLSLAEPTEISHEGKLFCVNTSPWDPAMTGMMGLYFKAAIGCFGVLCIITVAGMIIGINFIKKGKREGLNDKQDQDTL